jgi:hypothetical protein
MLGFNYPYQILVKMWSKWNSNIFLLGVLKKYVVTLEKWLFSKMDWVEKSLPYSPVIFY